MKIINNTNLPYRVIGGMIDMILEHNIGDTIYYGKHDEGTVEYNGKEYIVEIRYLKSYVEWRFDYYEN